MDVCKYMAFFRNSIASADFITLALISAYFAWRRGRGKPRNTQYKNYYVLGCILSIWIYVFCISCINLFEVCGEIGYDAVHGICHVISCEKCSQESTIKLPTITLLVVLGIGLPFIIILVSYSLVFKTLSEVETDVETWSQRRAVMILAFCYFIFILPCGINELLPETVSSRAFIRVGIYCWYWLVYVVNFFIYVIFWRRIRTAMILMLKDIMGVAGWNLNTKRNIENTTEQWWSKLQVLEACDLETDCTAF